MSRPAQIAPGAGNAPQSYEVPNATEVIPRAINATFDGTAASGTFTPTVEIISDGGVVIARIPCDTTVAAGATAECSFFPRVRKLTTPATSGSYQTVIGNLRATNQLIALWRLNEGATPYIDTSGFIPSDPANAARVALAVPMTQNYTPPALSNNQDATAVAFNADGTGGGNGDFLQSAAVDNTRFNIFGNGNYTIIAWVRPFAGVATSLGGVCGTFQLHGWAPPAGNTTGAVLNVNQPGQTVQLAHFNAVNYGAAIPTVTGSAISANAWHMIAATYDGANARIYIDGALDTGPTALAVGTPSSNAPNIGVGQDSTATANWFYGAIQEVSLWRATLSAANISALYTAGTT